MSFDYTKLVDAGLINNPNNIPLPNHPEIPNPVPILGGTAYFFQGVGVTLRPHTHDALTVHDTICVLGTFDFIVTNADGTTTTTQLFPGRMLCLAPNETHSFVCTSLDAAQGIGMFVNLIKAPISVSAIKLAIDPVINAVAQLQNSFTALQTAQNEINYAR